jgi:hypothetical protein
MDIGKTVTYNFVQKYKEVVRLKAENIELKRKLIAMAKEIKTLKARLGEDSEEPTTLH